MFHHPMPSAVSRFQEGPERKRRAHAKSRRGCANCKLRRVKCDETRPCCKKCLSYGVSCNYDGKEPNLKLVAQGSFQVDLSRKPPAKKMIDMDLAPRVPPVSTHRTMVAMANDSLNSGAASMETESMTGSWFRPSYWTFTEAHLEIMKRFQERTAMTIGTKRTAPAFRDCIFPLAFNYPFLMHMVLSLTLMHDAHLSPQSSPLAAKYTRDSLQHWNLATILYNRILSQPINPSARDAIWATCALIGATVFAYIESSNVEEAWPLKPSEPNDLDWLKLGEGKKAIWKLSNPHRPDSVFHGVSKEHANLRIPTWVKQSKTPALPDHMKRLFDIGPGSTVENNVYHLPALILSHLQHMTPNHENALDFLFFMGYMTAEFRGLLEIKDPRALLLLGWWFKKLEHAEQWWLRGRAKVEGRAVTIWLERWCGGEHGLFEKMGAEAGIGLDVDHVRVGDRLPVATSFQEICCPVQ